jgi:hypothetical protein
MENSEKEVLKAIPRGERGEARRGEAGLSWAGLGWNAARWSGRSKAQTNSHITITAQPAHGHSQMMAMPTMAFFASPAQPGPYLCFFASPTYARLSSHPHTRIA